MSIKHEGLSANRCPSNPLEAAFAAAWKKQAPCTLPYLLHYHEHTRDSDLTQEEATVAATIIQWLGSPVGSDFVREVHESMRTKKEKGRKL